MLPEGPSATCHHVEIDADSITMARVHFSMPLHLKLLSGSNLAKIFSNASLMVDSGLIRLHDYQLADVQSIPTIKTVPYYLRGVLLKKKVDGGRFGL